MNNKLTVMRVVCDNAIIQANVGNTVFGYAAAGADLKLTVTGGEREVSLAAKSNDNGRWEITLPPFEASFGKYKFRFESGEDALTFDDIMFGELFHISGQSNMELPMERTYDPLAPEEFPVCEDIREFRVPIQCCFGKEEEYEDFLGGEWKSATAENVPGMSAAGYWCALELYKKYNVPIGLLNTSAGGSAVGGRMPYKMLREFGWYDDYLEKATAEGYMENVGKYDSDRNTERYKRIAELDKVSERIFTDETGFTDCTVPFMFGEIPELKGFCGILWFRRTFDIPADADLSDALVILGTLTDADKTYLNGRLIGETGYMYPPRIYPAETLVHGRNTLLVQLDVKYAGGGFTKDKPYCVKLRDRVIDISGGWGYKAAATVPYMENETFFPSKPLAMYAAMTAPAFNVKCRAMLWYQGETDCYNAERYGTMFRKFVEMYRERCGYEIPVITTQLCNFDDPFAGGRPCWAELREQQRLCLEIPATDMAVTIDIGEDNDLHPRNKRDVGKRLARCVMRTVYGDKTIKPDIFCTGAEYLGCTDGSGKVLLTFTDNSRVTLKADAPSAFELCFGEDVIPASSAELSDSCITLTFPSDRRPDSVRCEWSNAPEAVVLFDTDGLPLSPFSVNVG